MDDQQRSNLYQHDPRYDTAYITNQNASMTDPNSNRRGSCSQGHAHLSSTGGHPPPYPHHLAPAPFDPNFYQRNMYGFSHIQSAALRGLTGTGLNQINPVLLVSPNDNNNCNRSRAASMSSVPVLEHFTASQHPHRPLPTYFEYAEAQKAALNYAQNLPNNNFRRNSTSSTAPHSNVPCNDPIGQQVLPTDQSKLTSGHPAYNYSQYMGSALPYLVNRGNFIYPVTYKEPFGYGHVRQPSPRRDRYSIGPSLPSSVYTNLLNMNGVPQRRRNSIPTALEVQQISEETSPSSSSSFEEADDEDDDDVFDSAPQLPQQHPGAGSGPGGVSGVFTDKAFYLAKLQESRKRSLGEADSSRAKFICQDAASSSGGIQAENSSRRMQEATTSQRSNEEKRKDESMQCNESSNNMQTSDNQSESAKKTSSKKEEDVAKREAGEHKKQIAIRSRRDATLSRCSAPSPSILKTRKHIVEEEKEGSSSREVSVKGHDLGPKVSSKSPSMPCRSRSLPAKKQVAWQDEKEEKNKAATDDVIINSMNRDRLKKKSSLLTVKDRIGPYIIGPVFGTSPVQCITQYLVRKEGSYEFYIAKVLNMGEKTKDVLSGKMLLHSEHSMLTLLKHHPGVISHHGFHKDLTYNEKTGEVQERICLVLDCVAQHDFDDSSRDYLNLQQYVIKEKRLNERETIRIFTSIVSVVKSLHDLNVVHRDLKLGNMVFHRKTQRVILTNFCLGRHLMSDKELLKDQRGSPAYISPDVLSGKPYAGKPSDMWSLGVVLFMMLYGQFPFYDQVPDKLYQKIRKADFTIPNNIHSSSFITDIIRGLLTLNPIKRMTATETLAMLQQCAGVWGKNTRYSTLGVQEVPDIDAKESEDEEDQEDEMEEQQIIEAKLTRDLQMKLLSDCEDDDSAENHRKGFSRLTYQSTIPTAQHLSCDARPLTQDELSMHRRLITNATLGVRVQSAT